MSEHEHPHEHAHPHADGGHGAAHEHPTLAVDAADDSPLAVSRRRILQALGVTGAAAVAAPLGAAPAAAAAPRAASRRTGTNPWNAGEAFFHGDHHIHSQYSPDGMNPVARIVEKSRQYGMDWIVITDHGGVAHQKLSIDKITPDIAEARRQFPDVRVFQGLEWNIPGAEHATVFLPPGRNTVAVLKAFEGAFDGAVLAAAGAISSSTSAQGEPYALQALRYLDAQVLSGRIPIALMFANHPSRRGLDSPHEFRNWRDSAPDVAVGMEGAPGHQAAGIPSARGGIGDARGFYDFNPVADSFPGYAPTDAENPYRTYGGFDWITAKVGGLWDSLLSEGLPWWVTATSDSHVVHLDRFRPGTSTFNETGTRGDPVPVPGPVPAGDYWPGYYSDTLVGARSGSYLDIMRGLQAGKIVAVHGRLVDGVDLRVRATGEGDRRGVTLGGRTWVRRGDDVEVTVRLVLAGGPNYNGDVPRLAKVDLIAGPVVGPRTDRDAMTAPGTRTVETFEVPSRARGSVTFRHRFRDVDGPFYLRLRGSDGRQLTASGDPTIDTVGDDDPWQDLWFYANPVFVDVV